MDTPIDTLSLEVLDDIPRRAFLSAAVSASVAAVGLGFAGANIAGNLISGIALNVASPYVLEILKIEGSSVPNEPTQELERIARCSLLAVLYEHLRKDGRSAGEAMAIVRDVRHTWDGSLFPPEIGQEHIGRLLRRPEPMDRAQSASLTRKLLRNHVGVDWDGYAELLRLRFSEIYLTFLRTDRRAFRAATLCLQQQHYASLAEVGEHVRDVLRLLARPQPILERFDALVSRVAGKTIGLTDFQFKRRATTYFRRPSLFRKIDDFLRTDDPFKCLALMGPAGIGKSRLALELCDIFGSEYWLTGFFPPGGHWPEGWIPLQDTLIVIDYAGSKTIGGRSVFEWFKELYLNAGANQPLIRVILVDRTDQGQVWIDWRRSDIGRDLDDVTLRIHLDAERQEFEDIVHSELRRRTQRVPTAGERWAVEAVSQRLRGQFRPLFGLLAGATLAATGGTNAERWSPELLVESILKGQVHQWDVAGVTNRHLDLLLESTLTQSTLMPEAELLSSTTLASLQSLTDTRPEATGLGPITPDLLGEFFVLMRLRGEAAVGYEPTRVVASRSQSILNRIWAAEGAQQFLALLLQDYLAWQPMAGENPALAVAERVLTEATQGNYSSGLRHCCFAIAWMRPELRDWPQWLTAVPVGTRPNFATSIAIGLFNSTLSASDSVTCRKRVDQIILLHDRFGQDPVVREMLAGALVSAALTERDPSVRTTLADEIELLHDQHGHEPTVRLSLARALCNAVSVEPHPTTRSILINRIRSLHENYGHEPAVRELLARAINHAIALGPDPSEWTAGVDLIDALHEAHGCEPAVREQFARALLNVARREASGEARSAVIQRLTRIHDNFKDDAVIRELLATALHHTTMKPRTEIIRAAVEQLHSLHEVHGQEPVVRKWLAKSLGNLAEAESDPAACREIMEKLTILHDQHGQETAVREELARTLYNASLKEPAASGRRQFTRRLVDLHEIHGHEATVRLWLAASWSRILDVESNSQDCLVFISEIRRLHATYGSEPAIRQELACALSNFSLRVPDATDRWRAARELTELHDQHGREAIVRAMLSKALCSITIVESDAGKCYEAARDIAALHDSYGGEPSVRSSLAIALHNATVPERDPEKCRAIVEQLSHLHDEYPEEPELLEQLAGALYNTILRHTDIHTRMDLTRRLQTLHDKHGSSPRVREFLAKAFHNLTTEQSA